MEEKTFKTYDEMLKILALRGVNLSTPALRGHAKYLLQHEGYYNLINGYKRLFLSVDDNGAIIVPDKYIPGTTLDEIAVLCNFDKRLRSVFLRNILYIENNIKNLVAYTFSREHGHKNYLVYSNFDTMQKDAPSNITSLIAEIHRQISGRSSDPSIKHYLNVHGYVPLWVLNNILTLGTLSKFYSLMKQPERQEVAKIFKIQDNDLASMLICLSSIRNICAHGNRLYCFRTKRPLSDLKLHARLQISKSPAGEYEYGKRDLFAIMLIFKVMLPPDLFADSIRQIDSELSTLKSGLTVISEQDVLNSMGFPSEWKKKFLSLNRTTS